MQPEHKGASNSICSNMSLLLSTEAQAKTWGIGTETHLNEVAIQAEEEDSQDHQQLAMERQWAWQEQRVIKPHL